MSVLEISDLGCHLATHRGFITLSVEGKEIKRIPFDHVTAIITRAHGITYTQNLLIKLAKHNIPVVISNKAFMPVSMLLPIGAHHATSRHLSAQVAAKPAQQNKLWQKLIQRKVQLQAAVLDEVGQLHFLSDLVEQVNAGDTRNIEARAARHYWQKLYGETFRRDQDDAIPNTLLNYGYTIFRSALARQVCAAGLHPALGIHHKHPLNTFCLVDDLIEPYRPLIDFCVYQLLARGEHRLNALSKSILAQQLTQTVRLETNWISVEDSMQKLAQCLARAYLKERMTLKLLKPNLTRLDFSLD